MPKRAATLSGKMLQTTCMCVNANAIINFVGGYDDFVNFHYGEASNLVIYLSLDII